MTLYYEVEEILDKRINKKGKEEYKIKWEGYSLEESSWEPISNLKNVLNMIKEYNNNHKENSVCSIINDNDSYSKKKRKRTFQNFEINIKLVNDFKRKKKFKNLSDIYNDNKIIECQLHNNNLKDEKNDSDFNIIEIEIINNKKFVVIMNEKPNYYIEIIPFEKFEKDFPLKLENFLNKIR